MLKNLFVNWKTSAAGVSMIVASTIHLIFMIKSGDANETTWTRELITILGGIGLIAAGDAKAGQQRTEDLKADVKSAIETKDTTILNPITETPKIPDPSTIKIS